MSDRSKPKGAGDLEREPSAVQETEADDAVIGTALRWSLVVFVLVAVTAGGGFYWYSRKPTLKLGQAGPVDLPKTRDRSQAKIPKVAFSDITEAAGIRFTHVNGAYGDKLLPETMGGGCAFFDYDRDGDPDLLLVNSTYWPGHQPEGEPVPTMCLYRNDGHGHFDDVTAQSGLDVTFYGMGVAVGDYDNDGWCDIFISAVGPNRLFKNEEGTFRDVTAEAGVAGDPGQWSTSCGWIDYDNDGDLDLFVGNYVRWSKEIDLSLRCTLDGTQRAYCRPDAFEGTFSYLYRNDGGKFTDVSEPAGMQVRNVYNEVPLAKSLGVAPVDLNSDGWIDLVVANDTVQNLVFLNERNGTFKEWGLNCNVAFDPVGKARGAMGADTGRFRNDRTLGILIGNFANEQTALYVSQGDPLQFADEATATGLGPPSRLLLKFGVFFFDYDLDGRLDIFTANGHLEDDISKVQQSQRYEQPPQLYWNTGPTSDSEFVLVPEADCGAEFCVPMVGRGAAYADIDGDGDLDVLVTAIRSRPRLLRNDQQLGHHWLRVRLTGKRSNRDAIGAWVEAKVGGNEFARQVMPTRSYLSQVELPVTIGLGSATKVDRLVVRWPDGSTQEVKPDEIKIDSLIHIEQDTAAK
ncbi:MAG TPA: CRTAC1 family protein [Pirellulales bacterium]|nr:CRTAC1 family protein [Pirellulales bacterium]